MPEKIQLQPWFQQSFSTVSTLYFRDITRNSSPKTLHLRFWPTQIVSNFTFSIIFWRAMNEVNEKVVSLGLLLIKSGQNLEHLEIRVLTSLAGGGNHTEGHLWLYSAVDFGCLNFEGVWRWGRVSLLQRSSFIDPRPMQHISTRFKSAPTSNFSPISSVNL